MLKEGSHFSFTLSSFSSWLGSFHHSVRDGFFFLLVFGPIPSVKYILIDAASSKAGGKFVCGYCEAGERQ
jgi:hypothetical protein